MTPWYLPLLGQPFDLHAFNCWHLVREGLALGFGVDVPEHGGTDPRSISEVGETIDHEASAWIEVDAADARPGDVVVFNLAGHPMHVGLVVAPGLFLHVSEGIVSRVERCTDHFWSRRIVATYRHPRLRQAERLHRRDP